MKEGPRQVGLDSPYEKRIRRQYQLDFLRAYLERELFQFDCSLQNPRQLFARSLWNYPLRFSMKSIEFRFCQPQSFAR